MEEEEMWHISVNVDQRRNMITSLMIPWKFGNPKNIQGIHFGELKVIKCWYSSDDGLKKLMLCLQILLSIWKVELVHTYMDVRIDCV